MRNPRVVTYNVRPEIKELVTVLAEKHGLYLSQVIELAVLTLAEHGGLSKEVEKASAS
jgi:hypothetical protein